MGGEFSGQPFPEKFPGLRGPNDRGVFVRYATSTHKKLYYKFYTEEGVGDMEWYFTPYDEEKDGEHWHHIKARELTNGGLKGTTIEDLEDKQYIEFLKTGPIPPHVMDGTFRSLYEQVYSLSKDDFDDGIPAEEWVINRDDLACYYAEKKKVKVVTMTHPALIIFANTHGYQPRRGDDRVYVLHLVTDVKQETAKIQLRLGFWYQYRDGNENDWHAFTDRVYPLSNTLSDMAKWCLLFQNKHPNYKLTCNNCKTFMKELLVYLGITTRVLDGTEDIAPEIAKIAAAGLCTMC